MSAKPREQENMLVHWKRHWKHTDSNYVLSCIGFWFPQFGWCGNINSPWTRWTVYVWLPVLTDGHNNWLTGLCLVVVQHSKPHYQTSNCIFENVYLLHSYRHQSVQHLSVQQMFNSKLMSCCMSKEWFAGRIVGQQVCIRELNTCCLASSLDSLLLLSLEASFSLCKNSLCHISWKLIELGQPAFYML